MDRLYPWFLLVRLGPSIFFSPLTQHRYLNLCYGDPMFTKNPSLGDGSGRAEGLKIADTSIFKLPLPLFVVLSLYLKGIPPSCLAI